MERYRNDRYLRKLTCEKMRCGPEPKEPLWVRTQRDDGTFGISLATAPADLPVTGTAREPLAEELVDARTDAHAALTKPALAVKVGKDPKDGTYRRTLADLVVEGVVTKQADVKPIKYGLSPPTPLGGGTLATGDSEGKGATRGASGDSVATNVTPIRRGRRR